MKAVSILSMRIKRGSPHIWVESIATRRAGFEPGVRFSVEMHGSGVLLRVADDGDRLVSRKIRGESIMPVIDINSQSDLAPLSGHESARVVFGDRRIFISPLASELRRRRRLVRLQEHLADGYLETSSIATGGGILSHALHAGFQDAGIYAESKMCNEIRSDLAEHAMVHNDAFGDQTIMANQPLQELAFDEEVVRRLPEVDIVDLGLPCSGASQAGRSKNKIALPEHHSAVGHLIAPAIALLAKLNPVACVMENVTAYADSASAAILRGYLGDMGYEVHERELVGSEWGELEARRRWYLVAVTKGIPFDFDKLQPGEYPERQLSDVMEHIPLDDSSWSAMQYLKDKEARDIAAGKGFRMQIYDGSERSIATLTKGIAKRRSTDPFFRHPQNPNLLRLPTIREHSRLKGVPEHLVSGLCQTTGHELLGQSIVYRPVREIARLIGEALLAFRQSSIVPSGQKFACAA